MRRHAEAKMFISTSMHMLSSIKEADWHTDSVMSLVCQAQLP